MLGIRSIIAEKPAAPVFRAATVNDTWGVTPVLTKPAGTLKGDMLIAVLSVHNQPYSSITPPTGWAYITNSGVNCTNNDSFAAFWKLAGASEPSTYIFSCDFNATGVISSFSKTKGATPVAASTAVSGSNPFNLPALTGGAYDMTLACAYSRYENVAFDTPSGFTLLGRVYTAAVGNAFSVFYNSTGIAADSTVQMNAQGFSSEYAGTKIRFT